MGWRENGDDLRRAWRQRVLRGLQRDDVPVDLFRKFPDPPPGWEWTAKRYKEGLSPEFIDALEASSEGDMSPLADYVASEKPLSKGERELVSRKLTTRKSGRPKNAQLRGAATLAGMFYSEWRRLNKKLCTRDHGHCDEMKECSAQWMVEDWFCWGSGGEELTESNREDFIESVRKLLEKPKHLREHAGDCLVGFPLFGWEPKDHQN